MKHRPRRGGLTHRFAIGALTAVALAGCGALPSAVAPRSPSTTIAITTTTTTTAVQCTNQRVLSGWSNSALAAQVLVVPVSDAEPSLAAPEVAAGAGGVILFGASPAPNLSSQLAQLKTEDPLGVAPSIMSDEEGGAVQRLASVTGPIPSARQMGLTMSSVQIEQLATVFAKKLVAQGLTVDLAPVLDVDGRPGPSATNPDGTRSFSANPQTAAADGVAFAKGLLAGGLTPVVKHFPGLGGATGNTDVMSASTPPLATLESVGLVPFRAAVAAGLPAVMVSNASVPGLTDLPASISAVAINFLRVNLGFKGLIMTDSLSAQSIANLGLSVPQATVDSVAAGTDMILYNTVNPSSTFSATVSALDSAISSGRIPRGQMVGAVSKIMSFKGVDLCAS